MKKKLAAIAGEPDIRASADPDAQTPPVTPKKTPSKTAATTTITPKRVSAAAKRKLQEIKPEQTSDDELDQELLRMGAADDGDTDDAKSPSTPTAKRKAPAAGKAKAAGSPKKKIKAEAEDGGDAAEGVEVVKKVKAARKPRGRRSRTLSLLRRRSMMMEHRERCQRPRKRRVLPREVPALRRGLHLPRLPMRIPLSSVLERSSLCSVEVARRMSPRKRRKRLKMSLSFEIWMCGLGLHGIEHWKSKRRMNLLRVVRYR